MSESRKAWGLRFFSVLVAIVAWAVISFGQRERLSELRRAIPLRTVDKPANLVILDAPSDVEIVLSGPESRMETLNPSLLAMRVDLRDAVKGPQQIALEPEAVDVPQGIEVVSIEPSSITIELDELVTQMLPVRAEFSGEPAAGAVVTAWRVNPSIVAVEGPESVLQAVLHLVTEPVSLDGHAIDFEEAKRIAAVGSRVKFRQPVVTVSVTLEVPGAGAALEESPAP